MRSIAPALILCLPVTGCTVANFAMNVADRADLQNLFLKHYAEYVIAEQAAGRVPEATFGDWADQQFAPLVTYGRYYNRGIEHPELNHPPLPYEEWIVLEPGERPTGEVPEEREVHNRTRRRVGAL